MQAVRNVDEHSVLGFRVELMEVIAMARADRIRAETTEISTHGGRGRLCEAEGGTNHRARCADTSVDRREEASGH